MQPTSSPPPSPHSSPETSPGRSQPKIKKAALPRTKGSTNIVGLDPELAAKVKADRKARRMAHADLNNPDRDKLPIKFKPLYERFAKVKFLSESLKDKTIDSATHSQKKSDIEQTQLQIENIFREIKKRRPENIFPELNTPDLTSLSTNEKEQFCEFLYSKLGIDMSLELVEVILGFEVKNLSDKESINRSTNTLAEIFVGVVQRQLLLPVLGESILAILNIPDEEPAISESPKKGELWSKALIKSADTALETIIKALKKASPEQLKPLIKFYAIRYKTASLRNEIDPNQAVASLFILRFIGPLITTPKLYGIKSDNSKVKLTKVINGIVNQSTPKEISHREEYIKSKKPVLDELAKLLTSA